MLILSNVYSADLNHWTSRSWGGGGGAWVEWGANQLVQPAIMAAKHWKFFYGIILYCGAQEASLGM